MTKRIKATIDNEQAERKKLISTMEGYCDNSNVVNPEHYQSYMKDGMDCITAMQHAFGEDAVKDFCRLNAFKYLWRASTKGRNESIKKAVWYLDKFLELGGFE